ncbi:MAG: response regulator [Bacteroidetes bacterium]|jgi:two-component system phosphate regulon response regulator PhoB|nr:response regulator [Bacteroidota bacterium]
MTTTDPSDINILVVDDEESVVEVISLFLQEEGYQVDQAYDGEEALEKVSKDTDVILLDIMLPGLSGYEVCERIRSRAETETIPIIFLSAKSEEEDQIKGLMMGGDVYLTKPVSSKIIQANVKAVLRRTGVEENRVLEMGDLTIYEDEYRATLGEEDLGLTLTEFELLRYLVRHPKKAFTRQQLLETIWKDAMMVTERTVDAHIKNLREKLGDFAKHIQTVRGVGYRFVEAAEGANA